MPDHSAAYPDYDRLMQDNLMRVFNQRDAERRLAALRELYAEDAILYEPPDMAAKGHAAIAGAVTRLLGSMPPDYSFAATGPALGHHGIGRLRWQVGPPNEPGAVRGMDVARFEGGRIKSLHVFIEPTG